jgi:hypothetical protein
MRSKITRIPTTATTAMTSGDGAVTGLPIPDAFWPVLDERVAEEGCPVPVGLPAFNPCGWVPPPCASLYGWTVCPIGGGTEAGGDCKAL